MSKFDEMIAQMKAADYAEKRQFLQYFARMAEQARRQITPEDKAALLDYAYGEAEAMLRAIPEADSYKEKDLIFECEDFLMGVIMHLTGSAANIPEDKLIRLKALAELVNRERVIETTLDEIFSQASIADTDINRLLYWVKSTPDEYRKAKLWLGLTHYSRGLSKLSADARQTLAAFILSELNRLMQLNNEDAWSSLELLADVCKHFGDGQVRDALSRLLGLGRNHINFYAADSLLTLGAEIPLSVVDALARDLEYANLTYGMLQQHGKAGLFPAEFASEEYLAKSDLVHWLTYPTELGKAPDEIVYLGRIKQLFKKEVFHVFKFRSGSGTLGDDLRGKWLIGWSTNEGGTFSNFEEFAPYEHEPAEKALKLIKKRILG